MHVRFIPAMALLAGALALVGCGGGNGVAPSSKEEMKTGTETETETEPKALTETLPTGGSVGYSTVPRKISVASDGTPKKVGNVYFTCSGDEACVINIPAGADRYRSPIPAERSPHRLPIPMRPSLRRSPLNRTAIPGCRTRTLSLELLQVMTVVSHSRQIRD